MARRPRYGVPRPVELVEMPATEEWEKSPAYKCLQRHKQLEAERTQELADARTVFPDNDPRMASSSMNMPQKIPPLPGGAPGLRFRKGDPAPGFARGFVRWSTDATRADEAWEEANKLRRRYEMLEEWRARHPLDIGLYAERAFRREIGLD